MTEETKTESQKSKSIMEMLKEDAEVEADDLLNLDPRILEAADLKLPAEFEMESMAEEHLEHLNNYHKAKIANRAARASGDNQKAEQMFKLMSLSRMAVALIQSQYKGVKAISDRIGTMRAKKLKESRDTFLLQED